MPLFEGVFTYLCMIFCLIWTPGAASKFSAKQIASSTPPNLWWWKQWLCKSLYFHLYGTNEKFPHLLQSCLRKSWLISHLSFRIQRNNWTATYCTWLSCATYKFNISTISPFCFGFPPGKFSVPSSASPGKVPSAVVFAPSACAAARRRETPNPGPGGETPRLWRWNGWWGPPWWCPWYPPEIKKFIPKMSENHAHVWFWRYMFEIHCFLGPSFWVMFT